MASIIRRILGETDNNGTWVQADSVLSAKILGYSGRTTDRTQIKETILRRYGSSIRMEKDPATGIDYEIFVKDGFDARLQAGHIETTCVSLGHKISGAIATQFSEPTQVFALAAGSEDTNTEAASELLGDMRGERYIDALVQADHESIWVASMPIFVEFVDGVLQYRVIDPGKYQILYEETIESNEIVRPTNRCDIEDATCVVIDTGSLDDHTNTYIAIFGRSLTYPNGRYVSFRTSGNGREVPAPFSSNEESIDCIIDGEIANPLSWYANQNPDLDVPEYPVGIIYSGLVRKEQLFPVSDSLLQEALEADVAASHIRATSGDNAKGTRVFEKSEMGGTQPIPKTLMGEVVLEAGQQLKLEKADSAAPKIAWELLQESMVSTGLGYTVPDFYLSSKDHTVEAASGTALKVRSGQLGKLRERRTKLISPEIKKIFEVEKALISVNAEADESAITLLESCEQLWDPGEPESTESELEKAAAVEKLVASGFYDTIEALIVVYKFGSESDAIDKYEELEARRKKYPPLNQEEKDAEMRLKMQSKQGPTGGNNGKKKTE